MECNVGHFMGWSVWDSHWMDCWKMYCYLQIINMGIKKRWYSEVYCEQFWCISLSLKELPSAEMVTCSRWDSFNSSDDSLSITLLSPTTCTGSRGHLRMELAFLIFMKSPPTCCRETAATADYSIENGWCHCRSKGTEVYLNRMLWSVMEWNVGTCNQLKCWNGMFACVMAWGFVHFHGTEFSEV